MSFFFFYLQKTREEWQLAFIIASGVFVCGGVVYLLFAQSSVQSWALPPRAGRADTDDVMPSCGEGLITEISLEVSTNVELKIV